MPLHVTLVTTPEELAISRAIRREVFVVGQNVPESHETDDKDLLPTTRHYLGKDTETNTFTGTVRCLLSPELRKAKVTRVAVLGASRGKGHGAALLNHVHEELAGEYDTFVLSAQCDKLAFYEKVGYAKLNDEIYMEGGMKHCVMVKTVRE